MLETCPKNRMILGLAMLVAVTVVVLIFESSITVQGKRSNRQFPIENNSTCWLREKYTVIQDCHPCTEFEIASKSLGVCIHTSFKEVLRCSSGETVSRSCDKVAQIDRRNFLKFETFMFVIGLGSFLASYARQRILTRRTHLKIERQLNKDRL